MFNEGNPEISSSASYFVNKLPLVEPQLNENGFCILCTPECNYWAGTADLKLAALQTVADNM